MLACLRLLVLSFWVCTGVASTNFVELCPAVRSGCENPQGLAQLWVACEYCQTNECTGELGFWVYHNLALENERQYSAGNKALLSQSHNLFELAYQEDPSQGAALGLARTIAEEGDVTGAFQFLLKASGLAGDGHKGTIFHQMGTMMHDARQWLECKQLWEQAAALAPDKLAWAASAVFMRSYIADHTQQAVDYQVMAQKVPAWAGLGLELPPLHPWMTMHIAAPPKVRLMMADGFTAALRVHTKQKYPMLSKDTRDLMTAAVSVFKTSGKLRVGMLSADFKDKATSLLLHAVLQHMDPDIELYIYATTEDNDGVHLSDWRRSIRAASTIFREVHTASIDQLVRTVQDDQLAILLDMDGFSNEGLRRSEVLILRGAPLQVGYFVYMGSCGHDMNDYLISDLAATPPHLQDQIAEKLLLLPASFFPTSHSSLYPLPHPSTATRKSADDAFVFAGFSKHVKLRPDMFLLWLSLLQEVPNSRLWMLEFPSQSKPFLLATAENEGVDPSRIVFAPFVDSAQENFARLQQGADLVLDTSTYGGHTGAVDALWAGVPLLTCVDSCISPPWAPEDADQMAARVGASLLTAAGMQDELIAHSLEEYKATAIALATNSTRYREVHSKLDQARVETGAMQPERKARDLSRGLKQLWAHALSGAPAKHIVVPQSSVGFKTHVQLPARLQLGGEELRGK